ncbi:hypothetical protein [Marinococcus sp. PL1-022]|uniref:hypothetical protein n=1 Tax=Marinococcus sp. PL1-022 TaxID=3095363 RepID=UPI0029C1511D|nr:hypothetical protein [Marinococcus sp. PL1-022]MDX6154463.1 hypothetical protein [Marinococcus sp. PL1-022]
MNTHSLYAANLFNEILNRNTYEWTTSELQQARNEQTLTEQKEIYDNIVETLLSEKSDLQNVARQYKDLYEQIVIQPEDIQMLKETFKRFLKLYRSIPVDEHRRKLFWSDEYEEKMKKQDELLENFIELIDYKTLQTMQLLGFDYREAIGQPLNELCASLIKKKLKTKP